MSGINWIRWKPEDVLIACAGISGSLLIYDSRTHKLEKTFQNLHSSNQCALMSLTLFFPSNSEVAIKTLSWSHCGNLIATASEDTSVKVVDFASEKTVVTIKASQGKKLQFSSLLIPFRNRLSKFSLFFPRFFLDVTCDFSLNFFFGINILVRIVGYKSK